jgi:hypothetical protein
MSQDSGPPQPPPETPQSTPAAPPSSSSSWKLPDGIEEHIESGTKKQGGSAVRWAGDAPAAAI